MTPVERFAGLPPMVQDRLLGLVRVLGGASQREKDLAQWLIAGAADSIRDREQVLPTTELLDTLASLCQWMRHAAEPQEVRQEHGC